MRHLDLAPIAIAFLAFGCSEPPKAVFVDLNRVSVSDSLPIFVPARGSTKDNVQIPAVTSALAIAKSVLIQDKTEAKIELARRMVAADRDAAIRTLSRRMAAARSEEVDIQKRKALDELDARQLALLKQVYDQLFIIFQRYALERGPKIARSELLKSRRPDLYVSRTTPSKFAELQKQELAAIRTLVRKLEDDYDRQATKILDDAQIQLSAEQAVLQAKFETMRANAIEQAERDARRAIEKAGQDIDLGIGENRSVRVSAVRGESVRIPGSSQPSNPVPELGATPLINSRERQSSLDQQLEIWLKIHGWSLAKSRSGGKDATEEFIAWRKNHRVGH